MKLFFEMLKLFVFSWLFLTFVAYVFVLGCNLILSLSFGFNVLIGISMIMFSVDMIIFALEFDYIKNSIIKVDCLDINL